MVYEIKKKSYVVLYGQTGISNKFSTLTQAQKYAKKKANILKEKVEIDRLTEYRGAKKGMVDWSQSTHSRVAPSRNSKQTAPKRKPQTKKKGFTFDATGIRYNGYGFANPNTIGKSKKSSGSSMGLFVTQDPYAPKKGKKGNNLFRNNPFGW